MAFMYRRDGVAAREAASATERTVALTVLRMPTRVATIVTAYEQRPEVDWPISGDDLARTRKALRPGQ